MILSALLKCISAEPTLGELDFQTVTQFIDISRILHPHISLLQPYYIPTPPSQLSDDIYHFLSLSLSIPGETTRQAWTALKDIIWEGEGGRSENMVNCLSLFLRFGLSYKLCEYYYLEPGI